MTLARKKDERPGSAKAVGAYVPRVAKRIFEAQGFHSTDVVSQWPEIVGNDLAGFTAPERIIWPRRRRDDLLDDDTAQNRHGNRADGATLILRVDGPRAIEVQHCTAHILDGLNTLFGYRAITSIRIQQGPVTNAQPKQTEQKNETAAPDERGLERIEDDGLRAALARLGGNIPE